MTLQLGQTAPEAGKVAVPADWSPGEAALRRVPQGWTTLKPHLRMVQVR